MMRILAISDETSPLLTVRRIQELSPDVIVSCGDLPFDYVDYVASAANAVPLYVPGNHDRALRGQPLATSALVSGPNVGVPVGGVNLDGQIVEEDGVVFAGLGGSMWYRPGPNQYTEAQMSRRAWGIRARYWLRELLRMPRVDVLVTHSPPKGMGDLDDVAHRGFDCFIDLVEKLRPRFMLHGHIHPHGFYKPDRTLGPTKIINVIPFKLIEVPG